MWFTRFYTACIALACLVILAGATPSGAQDLRTVSGTVADSGGRTVAYVALDGGAKYRTITNAVGEFRLSVPPNVGIDINVRRIGFLPTRVRVEPGSDTTIRVTIQQLAVLMTTQIVRAQQQIRTLEIRGFYDRMLEHQRGALVGVFILPEEIEMRNPQRVSQPARGAARRPGAEDRRLQHHRHVLPRHGYGWMRRHRVSGWSATELAGGSFG